MKKVISKIKSIFSKVSDRVHPLTILFLGVAILMALMGLANGYEYQVLNIAVVVMNVISALLCQWYFVERK